MVKDLVLVGGGHSHAIALLHLAQKPLKDVQVTLISEVINTPYSGMIPGYLAGFYSYEDTHINLKKLTDFAGVKFCLTSAIALDLQQNQVICTQHPPITFDYLSLNIGSTPDQNSVPGAAKYTIPAKPVTVLLKAWDELRDRYRQHPDQLGPLVIVGGGAGGVELALNIQKGLESIVKDKPVEIIIIHRDRHLLTGHNPKAQAYFKRILATRNIKVYLQENVKEVLEKRLICTSGLNLEFDTVFWVTQAAAPPWLKTSGLTTDGRGFVLVENTLQTLSHPHIFAVGDIATMKNHPHPKAGVFAVRQGKPLFTNFQRLSLGKPLQPYFPQKKYLALIGTGDRNAVASWGSCAWESPLLWKWKNQIDRAFMQQFIPVP